MCSELLPCGKALRVLDSCIVVCDVSVGDCVRSMNVVVTKVGLCIGRGKVVRGS